MRAGRDGGGQQAGAWSHAASTPAVGPPALAHTDSLHRHHRHPARPGLPHVASGEEILRQTGGRLHAFVSGAGTGGTIAGVSAALKQRRPEVQVFLVDPPGSSLYNKVGRGGRYR